MYIEPEPFALIVIFHSRIKISVIRLLLTFTAGSRSVNKARINDEGTVFVYVKKISLYEIKLSLKKKETINKPFLTSFKVNTAKQDKHR